MLSLVRPETALKGVLIKGFTFALFTLILVPLTAILAFGTRLISTEKDGLKYYNEDF
jgi:hypothetical protein